MPDNRYPESGNHKLGKLFQACGVQRSVCKNRPYSVRSTQTMGFQTSQQQVKKLGVEYQD